MTSPSQVDLVQFHLVSGCAQRYRVLDGQADVDHYSTTLAVSRAAAVWVPTHRVRASDLCGGVLLAELRFLDQIL